MVTPAPAFSRMHSEIMDNFVPTTYIQKWGETDKSVHDFGQTRPETFLCSSLQGNRPD